MEPNSIYQSPKNTARVTSTMSDWELRSYYIQDEICVLAVGWFYLYFGSLLFSLSIFGIVASILLGSILTGFMSFCTFLVSFIYIILGWGMRHLDPWSRSPARFAALVMLFFFPAGTFTGLICFYLLRARSHEEVFSPRYRAILLEDPSHGKYHAIWLPLVGGTLTGLTVALSVYLFRSPLLDLLKLWR